MLSTFFEEHFIGLDASQITDGFCVALLIVFFASFYFKRNNLHQTFTTYTPTLLTSIGILGTFAGIIIGLLAFNTNDIDNSIGPLLEGLKTAFISSLIGMLLSIIYKAVVSLGFFKPIAAEIISDTDVSNIAFYEVMQKQVLATEQLKKAIAGDDDSSLINIMKLQRVESNDHNKVATSHLTDISESLNTLKEHASSQKNEFSDFQNRLWRQMQDFADMLSKSATEQVIEALKQVIQDFNNNLIEQFGDNFKELNAAVLELVKWQDNYKEQLSDMSEKYSLGVKAISETELSVANISQEAKTIPNTMNELKEIMTVNQHQISELDRHLESFAKVRDKAVEAVPEIQSQIDGAIQGAKAANEILAIGMKENANQMTQILAEGSEEFKNNVSQTNAALLESAQTTASSSDQIKEQFATTLEDINNHIRNFIADLQQGSVEINNNLKQAGDTLLSDTTKWNEGFSSNLEKVTSDLENTISAQANNHREQADKVFRGLESTIEKTLADTADSVTKQVDMIEKTSEQEIEKVMTSMGSALGSIANQFVADYSRLVDQMNQIVNRR